MKIKHLHFWKKRDVLLKCKYFVIISLNDKVLLFFNSSSITYILLNNSNIAYFWHNVFNKLNRTLILMGCRFLNHANHMALNIPIYVITLLTHPLHLNPPLNLPNLSLTPDPYPSSIAASLYQYNMNTISTLYLYFDVST